MGGAESRDSQNVADAKWFVAGLTILALALRLWGLNSGLWIDEIYSLLQSFRPPLSEIVTVFPRDNQHPLYSVLAHVSLRMFGESPWSIRLPAVLFGVASVPLLYALGAQVMNRREGLLAAALLAVSYHHIWFSQNARGYSALAFFAILSTWLLLRALERPTLITYAGYAVAAALGAYTHLTMVFVVLGHAVVITIRNLWPGRPRTRWRDDWSPWLGFGAAGALTLLCYAPILTQVQQFFLHHPSELKGVSTPSWAVSEAIRVLMLGLGGGTGLLAGVVVLTAATLFLVGVVSYARRAPLALGLFVAPGVVTIAGALAARGTMYPRFFFALIGFGILIGVRGTMAAAEWLTSRLGSKTSRPAVMLGSTAIGALLLLSCASLGFNYRYPKQDFEGARRWVEEARGAGERVVTVGVTTGAYRDWLQLPWASVDNPSQLETLQREGQRTWLVYTFPRYIAPELMGLIRQDCPTARTFPGTVGGGDIIVCTLAPMAAPSPESVAR